MKKMTLSLVSLNVPCTEGFLPMHSFFILKKKMLNFIKGQQSLITDTKMNCVS